MNQSLNSLIIQIIRDQQHIIGGSALKIANNTPGLRVSDDLTYTNLTGDPKTVTNNLIDGYGSLFGDVAIKVCAESFKKVRNNVPIEQVPDRLKS